MYTLHTLHNYTPLYIDYTHEDSIDNHDSGYLGMAVQLYV